jgi:hypothetical protein
VRVEDDEGELEESGGIVSSVDAGLVKAAGAVRLEEN